MVHYAGDCALGRCSSHLSTLLFHAYEPQRTYHTSIFLVFRRIGSSFNHFSFCNHYLVVKRRAGMRQSFSSSVEGGIDVD